MFSGLMSRWTMPVLVRVLERLRRLARDTQRVVHRELTLSRSADPGGLSPSMNGMVNQSRPADFARNRGR